jgi:hypothetical protein
MVPFDQFRLDVSANVGEREKRKIGVTISAILVQGFLERFPPVYYGIDNAICFFRACFFLCFFIKNNSVFSQKLTCVVDEKKLPKTPPLPNLW